MWSHVYLGPPDFISVDQGTSYISEQMHANCEAAGIRLIEVPVESPGTIGIVESYNAPLRAAYEKIRDDLGHETTDEQFLEMAVHVINCTMGPEGICPAVMVFGTIPRPARRKPSQTQLQRAQSIEEARAVVTRVKAKKRLEFGLKHSHGPKAKEQSAILERLPAGSQVLVYRNEKKRWTGPFLFISVNGEKVVIQTKKGRRIYRSTFVKPYTESALRVPGREKGRKEQGNVFMTTTGAKKRA